MWGKLENYKNFINNFFLTITAIIFRGGGGLEPMNLYRGSGVI